MSSPPFSPFPLPSGFPTPLPGRMRIAISTLKQKNTAQSSSRALPVLRRRLRHVPAGHRRGRPEADAALEARRAPVHEAHPRRRTSPMKFWRKSGEIPAKFWKTMLKPRKAAKIHNSVSLPTLCRVSNQVIQGASEGTGRRGTALHRRNRLQKEPTPRRPMRLPLRLRRPLFGGGARGWDIQAGSRIRCAGTSEGLGRPGPPPPPLVPGGAV